MRSESRSGFDADVSEMFVGRAHEMEFLEHMTASVAQVAGTVVIIGEVGIGKSALLRRVARACAARVLWVRGSEAESMIPFAAAADLLTPLQEHFVEVPPTQRRALEVALAVSDGPSPAELPVCAGALGVLTAAAEAASLVVLVDDHGRGRSGVGGVLSKCGW